MKLCNWIYSLVIFKKSGFSNLLWLDVWLQIQCLAQKGHGSLSTIICRLWIPLKNGGLVLCKWCVTLPGPCAIESMMSIGIQFQRNYAWLFLVQPIAKVLASLSVAPGIFLSAHYKYRSSCWSGRIEVFLEPFAGGIESNVSGKSLLVRTEPLLDNFA